MPTRLLLLILAAFVAPYAAAQTGFGPAVPVATGPNPEAAAAADLNGDGLRDLATTIDAPDRIVINFNQGGGAFGAPVAILTGAGTSPHALAPCDLDGDGDLDLAVTLKGIDALRVYFNQGAGIFTAGATTATGADPRGLAVSDWNGDGAIDLATSNRDGASITILANDGQGGMTAVATLAAGQEPRGIAAADLDQDLDQDLAVADHDARAVLVFTNQGGFFAAGPVLSTGAQLRPADVVLADLDNDADVDVAAAANGGGLEAAVVFPNAGGAFGAFVPFATGGIDTSAIAAADFDGDGAIDLATANRGSNDVSVLLGTGGGAFGAPSLLAVGIAPQDLTAADLDGNGSVDLVTANGGSSDDSVLLNGQAPPPSPSLALLTPPVIGTTATVRLTSPADAGRVYLCPFALSTTPGTPLGDGRTFPLNVDEVFVISITPGNPFFQNVIGAFGPGGVADVLIHIPPLPLLVGQSVFTAFIVFDPVASLGLGTISPPLPVTFQ